MSAGIVVASGALALGALGGGTVGSQTSFLSGTSQREHTVVEQCLDELNGTSSSYTTACKETYDQVDLAFKVKDGIAEFLNTGDVRYGLPNELASRAAELSSKANSARTAEKGLLGAGGAVVLGGGAVAAQSKRKH
jgi:hypothetical protein